MPGLNDVSNSILEIFPKIPLLRFLLYLGDASASLLVGDSWATDVSLLLSHARVYINVL